MKSAEIRQAFLDFFAAQGHEVVPSSSLVPGNDPTLLFTNAGMVQFKDVFTGRDARPYRRAASSQRCVRAGGKHNDLENVGYTARHHTFFEMLGNFSFGDYFKQDAISFAWRLLTERLGLPADRLWVTVHDSDDEAAAIWTDVIGVPADRVTRMGDKDNFWAMGDTGPCGPCSEIFFDHGPDVAGGPPGTPDEDGDRYVEIWNLVFMQFERASDGTLTDLPRPSVDTGMGLERIAAVLQGVHSNYDIDLFRNLIAAVGRETGAAGVAEPAAASLRVIADHIRAAAFLVIDGVLPGNEGRGYVLRRIIRRALRHGHKLGCSEPFFHRLVDDLAAEMGDAYPELSKAKTHVRRVLLQEEEQFARTLGTGMEVFEQEVARLESSTIPGAVVFKLYDTYGFPVDLTADVARERGLELDLDGFEREMNAQRDRARAASRFAVGAGGALDIDGEVEFTGYESLAHDAAIVALFRVSAGRHEAVTKLEAGEQGVLVLDQTPFYAESGGQVGDTGSIENPAGRFRVTDTRPGAAQHLHLGQLEQGHLSVGDGVSTRVDGDRRMRIARNHSATHLLHAALREILGAHVEQKGSLVAEDRLRFDFSHYQAVTEAELEAIETRVNEQIWQNTAVATELMDFEAARERGAVALFGEKYGDRVRVLSMGDGFSTELCGGTHVQRTGDIGLLRIVAEQGVASGVRRIEAVTASGAVAWMDRNERLLERIADALKAAPEELERKVATLVEDNRALEKRLSQMQGKLAAAEGDDLAASAVTVGDIKVLARQLEVADPKAMLATLDQLKNKLGRAVIVLAAVHEGKVALIAGVTADLTDRMRAGDLIKWLGEKVGARGGGRPDMARAGGGEHPEALPEALQSVSSWVAEQAA
ncbi:MAG: alanine--tRNA ligase [Gammaproteobacteria bacterium]|nr:alanine--tRNA ligase [Gammaproteobacteria bacterium]